MDQQRRLQLHEILCDILGSRYVYFQPPSTIQMKYPCIIYARGDQNERYADGFLYSYKIMYDVTIIDPNPDSAILYELRKLQYCSFDRHYVQDNLNHDVFTIYY